MDLTSLLSVWGGILQEMFWVSLPLAAILLGIHWAANHTWIAYEEGKHVVKGLILHKVKLWLDKAFDWLDEKKIASWLRDLPALVIGIGGPVAGILIYFLVRPNPWLLTSLLLTVSLLFYGKKWKDIGVFILGCHKCMPTFWIGLPLLVSGLIMFLSTWEFSYLGRIPAAIIMLKWLLFYLY